ncbi:ATP-dependent Clp protease ATP-binding subunit [Candidatus Uhrbacteria bacterium]|nr:ATP-dependent Clp protease ATP-binding subunit [Candidatus Uhrbacteria bacterium]
MPYDIVDKFSSHLKNVLTRALCFVVETDQKAIHPEHLLWALGTQKGCIGAEILKKSGVKLMELKKLAGVRQVVHPLGIGSDLSLHLSQDAKRIVEKAVLTANMYGHRYVGTEHLLSGILQIESSTTQQFFLSQQTDMKELRSQLAIVLKSTSRFPDLTDSPKAGQAVVAQPGATQPKEAAQAQEKKISAVEYFSVELTTKEAQKRIDPVIGRDLEIERLMEILCRRTKNNPLLQGEPGVGKTAIVEGLAKKIVEGTVPPVLSHKRIFALDMALIVAGTMYRGEFEGRLRQIVDEVKQDPEMILFIDEIHSIVGAGSASGSLDAANILKPALARGEIRCIGATTPGEFKKYIETDAALERRFQSVFVEEPSREKTVEILEGVAPHFERFHRVRITHDAIVEAVQLSERYIQDRQLPDKAIDLIDEAAAATRVRDVNPAPIQKERALFESLDQIKERKRQAVVEERFSDALDLKAEEDRTQAHLASLRIEEDTTPVPVITEQDIARVVSRATGIPLDGILERDLSELMQLEDRLRASVLGQDATLEIVAGALRRAKAGVAHPKRPLASFLFLGPSGVGKTELAKAVAHTLFHSKNNFIRLDMSEYAEGFTMSKLIGAPAGYIGYKETANLTDRVKQRPYSVVLFDEIEKAHRDVQNLLLQILEEGELADATGRTINFKNTVIILTSNVGLERFEQGEMGFMGSEGDRTVTLNADLQKELIERFRPELLNRIDHTCVFNLLTTEILTEIAHLQLKELSNRLQNQGLTLQIHASVAAHLAKQADTKSGARQLRNLIEKDIEHKIAEHLSQKNRPRALTIKLKDKKILVCKHYANA